MSKKASPKSATTKKVTAKKATKKSVVISTSDNEDEQETNTVSSLADQDVITDWTKESTLHTVGEDANNEVSDVVIVPETTSPEPSTEKKSVLDFDRSEVLTYEDMTVSSMSNDQLLMILIRRGEEQKNPVISGGCERLLRQINRESINHFRGNQNFPRKRFNKPNYNNEYDPEQQQQRSRSRERQPNPLNTPQFADPILPGDPNFRGNRRNRQTQTRERIPREEFQQKSRNYSRGPRFDSNPK